MSELTITLPGKTTGYRVQLPVFVGPLDLLLHLIEREELDITRISLARVAHQYLEYLDALEQLQVDDLSDFIVVAARLLLIKSQALLPRSPITLAHDDEDAGEALVHQLRAYKMFKEAAKLLDERQSQGQRSYVRLAPQPNIPLSIDHLEPVSLDELVAAAHRAMKTHSAARRHDPVVAGFTLTIEDQIDLITRSVKTGFHIRFLSLLTSTYTRQEVAVTLLALLELIKQRRIHARQEQMFGEILIYPQNVYLPSG